MGARAAIVLYLLVMVALVISVDVLFFRHHSLGRLLVNIGIVLVFAGSYMAFIRRP